MAAITRPTPSVAPTTGTASSLRWATVKVGVVAAAITTAVAAGLHAVGVSFEIDGEMIPLAGFAQMTLLGAVIGGLLAGSLRKRSVQAHRRFLQFAVTLTVLSCVPSVAMPSAVSTKLGLVVTHLVAAAIIVPFLARRLAD